MPKWVLFILGIYLLISFFLFLKGKLKDPLNPAGFVLPKVQATLQKLRK